MVKEKEQWRVPAQYIFTRRNEHPGALEYAPAIAISNDSAVSALWQASHILFCYLF
jgi:hypothetical protein